MKIDFSGVTTSGNIANEDAAAHATSLAAAENAAVKALDAVGVAYFDYQGNEYFIATNQAETTVSAHDVVVNVVGLGALNNAYYTVLGFDSHGVVTIGSEFLVLAHG
jgi:hypothetical protein